MDINDRFEEIRRRHDRLMQLHDTLKTDYISSMQINPKKSAGIIITIKYYEDLIKNDEKLLTENGIDFKHAVYLERDMLTLSTDTLYQERQANQVLVPS